jgi:hypothetical protein
MATTTNYGWTTPNDTDLVKDGAAAIRTLGSSVDTTTKALNPSTTLGDVEYRSATANTNTRLGIGTTGQVLTVAGGVPTWAAPAAGGQNWTLLNAGGTALTGASTITVSGISAKNAIMILVSGAGTDTANSTLTYRLNADSGSNYSFYGSLNLVNNVNTSTAYGSFFQDRNSTSTTSIPMSKNSDTDSNASGYLQITGCNASGVKVFQGANGVFSNNAVTYQHNNIGGFYSDSSTISSVSIISSAGNFDQGTIYVYTTA